MIIFTGDLNFTDWYFNVGFGIGTNISKGLNPLQYLPLKDEDLWIGNFEGVASQTSINKGLHAESFRVDPTALKNMRHANFYCLANNHAMEHGPEAFRNTVNSLEQLGSRVFGLKDKKSIVFTHKGRKCTITGLSLRIESPETTPLFWYNPEFKEIESEFLSLPTDAFKILYVHWGNEYINRPSAQQKKFAHWLLDSGFDLIIGSHPHVLQGFEDYKGKRIYYSLGNCVFDMPSEQCEIGALVELDFLEGHPIYSEKYIKIDKKCCPYIVQESSIPSQWKFNYLNTCLKIDDNTEEYHNIIREGYLIYRRANRRKLLLSAFSHPLSFTKVLIDFFKRKF